MPEQHGCSNLLELCLALPHVCYVHPLPTESPNAEQEHWVCAAVYLSLRSNHKCVVAASQEQRRKCVASKAEKVSVEESTKEKVKEGKDTCALETSIDLSELKGNVARVFKNNPGGILKSVFDSQYEEVIGQKLEARRLGFFNTNALPRPLHVTQDQRGKCLPSKAEKVSEKASNEEKVREGKETCALATSADYGEMKTNVARVLKNNPGVILKSAFDSQYEEVIGQKLKARRFGFFNTNALLRSLKGNVVYLKVPSGSKEVMLFSHNG